MDFETIDNVYRSRKTLMDILELRGFDTAPYQNFSPIEVAAASVSETFAPLGFIATSKTDPKRFCDVRYARVTRQKMASFFEKDEDTNTEIIVMTLDPVADMHHQMALRLVLKGIRVSFFYIPHIVNNPMLHTLVPKHELVPADKEKGLMESFHIRSKSKFPLIRFHVDPIIRILGGVPGNLVKITRASSSALQTETYRVISP
jgi:DNA-directed RNA polymerase subunit H (RpoH/RPB5)